MKETNPIKKESEKKWLLKHACEGVKIIEDIFLKRRGIDKSKTNSRLKSKL